MKKIEPERIERAARIYASNQEASQALGIAPGSFSRLCRLYQIETPYARKRRRRQECHRRRRAKQLLREFTVEPEMIDLELEAVDLDLEEILEIQQQLEKVL